MRRLGVAAALAFAAMPSAASAAAVTAGALTATVHASPWHVEYNAVDEAPGSLAFTAGGVTARATRAVGGHMVGRAYVATLRTTDPQGRTIAVRIAPTGNGIITVDATGPPGADDDGGRASPARVASASSASASAPTRSCAAAARCRTA